MSCSSPIYALRIGYNEETGKDYPLVFKRHYDDNLRSLRFKYGFNNIVPIPCGHCLECKKARRREWSVRCAMEAQYHKSNYFITLTYDEKHYPGCLKKSDLQDFIREVRREKKFRYYACGEVGSRGRAHFHLCAFGLDLNDLIFFSNAKSGYAQYHSAFLDKCWNKKGFITVSYFSPDVAGYVAGYVDKKLSKDNFTLCSTDPGIGYQYIVDHLDDLLKYDVVVLPGITCSLPRYVLKVADKLGYDLSGIKNKRISQSYELMRYKKLVLGLDHDEEVLRYDHIANIRKNALTRRSL